MVILQPDETGHSMEKEEGGLTMPVTFLSITEQIGRIFKINMQLHYLQNIS